MRFPALISLLAHFLIQSQIAHADFKCKNARHPTAKTGYCAILSGDYPNSQGPVYLVKPADDTYVAKGTFSCAGIKIFGAVPNKQWCCGKPPTIYYRSDSSGLTYTYSAGEALYNCYSAPDL